MRLLLIVEVALVKRNVCQIFDGVKRTGTVFINECLTESMINITHPTVLSSGDTL